MDQTAKQIARQRIQTLFQQATLTCEANPQQAQEYIRTARRIAMAARVRLPQSYRRMICKKCNSLLIPGETSRIRIRPKREPHVVITCLTCKKSARIPIKRGK